MKVDLTFASEVTNYVLKGHNPFLQETLGSDFEFG